MSSCKFTLNDKDGNIILSGVTEQEFKKYLALNAGKEQKLLGASRIIGEAIEPEVISEFEDVSDADVENALRESIRTPFRNKQKLDKTSKGLFSRILTRLVDSQINVIDKILKDFKYTGKIAVAALKNRKGYNGLSSIRTRLFNAEIFDDLKITPNLELVGDKLSEKDMFDIFLNLNRVIKIDNRIRDKFYEFMSLRDKLKNNTKLSDSEKADLKVKIDNLKEYLYDRNVLGVKNGDYVLRQYVHSQNKTSQLARGELNRIKNKYPDIYKKFEKKGQSYYDAYKTLLYEQYKNGMIAKDVYNELLSYDYIPTRYIQHIVENELSEAGSKSASKLSTSIKNLTGGSDSDVMTNFQAILEIYTNSTYKKIFENRAAKSLADAIIKKPVTLSESKELIKAADAKLNPQGIQDMNLDMYIQQPIGQDKFGNPTYGDIPAGMDAIYFYRADGKRERIIAPKDFVDVWYDRNNLLTPSGEAKLSGLSKWMGNNIFKSLTTKNNPAFAVYQILMDAPQAIIATNAYPDFFLGSFMLAKDYASVSKDIIDFIKSDKLSPLFKEAVEAGIFSDFLSTETDLIKFSPLTNMQGETNFGTILKLMKAKSIKAANSALDSIAKLNEGVEYATRLAVYKRVKQNITEQFLKENKGAPLNKDQEFEARMLAAEQARNMVDFSRSGTYVKPLNKVFAYLNAGVQAFYSTARALKNNPTKAAVLLGEIGLAGTTLLAYSLGDFGGDEEEKKKRLDEYMSLPDYQRSNYFNIYNPFGKEGSSYRWIRLYKPQAFRGFLNMMEQGYLKNFKKIDIDEYQIVESFKNDLPVDPNMANLLTRNPLINGVAKYSFNYDAYRKQYTYKNEEKIEDWAEYDKNTGDMYKKAGELTKDSFFFPEGISPIRAQAFVESLIGNPEKNTTTALLDKAGRIMYYGAINDKDGLSKELPAPGEEADWLFKLSGLKGRLFTKTPEIDFEFIDKLKKEERKQYTQNKFIKEQVDEIFAKSKDKNEALLTSSNMLDELIKNGDLKPDSKKRILDIQDKRDFIKGKPRFYGDLLYSSSNDSKVTILDYETESMDDKKFSDLMFDLRLNNIISKDVLFKVQSNRYAREKKK
jgi:hypothetical protein